MTTETAGEREAFDMSDLFALLAQCENRGRTPEGHYILSGADFWALGKQMAIALARAHQPPEPADIDVETIHEVAVRVWSEHLATHRRSTVNGSLKIVAHAIHALYAAPKVDQPPEPAIPCGACRFEVGCRKHGQCRIFYDRTAPTNTEGPTP